MKISKYSLGKIKFDKKTIEFQVALWRKYVESREKNQIGLFSDFSHTNDPLEKKIVFLDGNTSSKWQKITRMIQDEMIDQNSPIMPFSHMPQDETIITHINEANDIILKLNDYSSMAVNSLIKNIIILKCSDFIAASSSNFLGIVVMAPKTNWHVLDYVENIIHEASHIDLFICQLLDPLVISKKLIVSPYRSLLRPAIGVFHAAFVLSRIVSVMNQLIALQIYPHKAEQQLIDNIKKLVIAVNALEKGIKLTKLGHSIFDNIKETLSNVQSTKVKGAA